MRPLLLCVIVLCLPIAIVADPPQEKKDEFKLTKEEQEVLDLTNAERKNAGLPPLKANAKLFTAARSHSMNMAAKNQIAHFLNGKGPGERLADVDYAHLGWAENVAAGQRTPQEAIQSWMNSEGHKANILSRHAEIGIGIAATADGTRYWTQVFANPR